MAFKKLKCKYFSSSSAQKTFLLFFFFQAQSMYEYAALMIALTLINTIVVASVLCEQAYDNMEEVTIKI